MSTTATNNTAEAPQQLDRVRDTMSFNNILASPPTSTDSPEYTVDTETNVPAPTPPVTPTKNGDDAKHKEETASPAADPEVSDLTEVEVTEVFAEDDADDLPDDQREFICKNDETSRCVTGQYTKELSRKVISDHFGRNKACTRDITSWPLFCRKHYQRATYNKDLWQIRKLDLIYRQIDKIEEQFPGTTYTISLKKSEAARLEKYGLMALAGRSKEEAAKAVAPVEGKHFEAPIEILRELYDDMGEGRSIDQVKDVIEKIHRQVLDGATLQVPSIEFLPNLGGKKTSPKKAPKTPTPKKARVPKTPKQKGTPTRVSAKGSIKKPARKA